MLYRYEKRPDGKLVKKAIVYTREEHRINIADVDHDAVFITGRLRSGGHESYVVGGAVRDLMLGKKPKDFDIVTGATPAQIKRIFRNSRIIGRRFRLVHVFFGPKIFEVSTFRSLKDGHTSNTYGTIEEDVLRRDFSFNALFYDPGKQLVVDYVGGMEDIRKKRLRPIIPEAVIFQDDPVRMIRAVKYAAAGGFTIPWLLRRRIKKEAPLLAGVSPSRLTEEMGKIVRSPRRAAIVENLEEAGLYQYLQKEASALMKGNSAFRRKYLASLAESIETPPGETGGSRALAALVRDYLDLKISWGTFSRENREQYKEIFFDIRRFVLPMNPPRVELDKALRLVFAEHGITIKKIRLFDRERKQRSAENEHPAQETLSPPSGKTPSGKTPHQTPPDKTMPPGEGSKRRRRRRRSKSFPDRREIQTNDESN